MSAIKTVKRRLLNKPCYGLPEFQMSFLKHYIFLQNLSTKMFLKSGSSHSNKRQLHLRLTEIATNKRNTAQDFVIETENWEQF